MLAEPLVGLVTGILVGSMGIGAGAVATPSLILMGIAPVVAVGTDLLFAFFLKIFAVALYGAEGEVDVNTVKRLLIGGVPALLVAYLALTSIASKVNVGFVNILIRQALGAVLILVSLLHFTKLILNKELKIGGAPRLSLEVLGFIACALLFITSVGSGVLIVAVLLNICPTPRTAVGTSLTFSLFTTLIAGLMHFSLGNMSLRLTLLLLAAGVPGVFLGHRISKRVPRRGLTGAVSTAVMLLGVLMLI